MIKIIIIKIQYLKSGLGQQTLDPAGQMRPDMIDLDRLLSLGTRGLGVTVVRLIVQDFHTASRTLALFPRLFLRRLKKDNAGLSCFYGKEAKEATVGCFAVKLATILESLGTSSSSPNFGQKYHWWIQGLLLICSQVQCVVVFSNLKFYEK